jgi:hypothetical protein
LDLLFQYAFEVNKQHRSNDFYALYNKPAGEAVLRALEKYAGEETKTTE